MNVLYNFKGGILLNNTIDDKLIGNENNIVFYTDKDDNVNVEVILQNEDV